MDKEIASKLIKVMAEAVKNDPAQFNFNIDIIGAMGTASNGGTGISTTAVGGGPGSTTIGLQSSVGGSQIKITKSYADAAMLEKIENLYSALNEIAEKVKTDDKSTIEKIYNSLKNTWVPGVITSVLGKILSLSLGITI